MRKRGKPKTGKRLSQFDFFRLGRKKNRTAGTSRILGVLKVILLICVLAGIGLGFIYLEQYVRAEKDMSATAANIELINAPQWLNAELEQKVLAAVRAHGEDLRIDEEVAESVYRNITELVPWIYDVRIQTTHDAVTVAGLWRKPLAAVKVNRSQVYVDKDRIVLDCIPIPDLPIVEITGLNAAHAPAVGQTWQRDDLAAALDILTRLDMMDNAITPEKPLLRELTRIDVSNFAGRKDRRQRHIVLYARADTEIIWGAEFGTSQQYMEVSDDEKLARLYSYYKNNGSLLTSVKYINLCDPQDNVPQPIDRFQSPSD